LTWIHELSEKSGLREAWNALALQMEKPEVFYTWEWAAALVRAYGDAVGPWIATAYEGDTLVGVAALAKPTPTEAVFLAGNTADYCDFISLPGKRAEFVAAVLRSLRESGTWTIVLANLPAESATVAPIRNDRSYRSFLRTGYICAQVKMGSEEGRRALANSLMKKKMFRRSMNTLRQMGEVTLEHDVGTDLGRGKIEGFCSLHVARFLSTGRISNLVSPQRREFLSELARLLAQQGWFDLMTLRVGSSVLALNYGFRFQGSWFWYQPTIVNKYEDLSPGYCLLAKIVEDASRDPEAQMVDLGLGAEGYKERFANDERTTLHATLSRSQIDLYKVRSRYHAAEAIKIQPGLESMARRAQATAQGGRKRAQDGGWVSILAWTARRLQRSIASTDKVLLFQWRPRADDVVDGQGLVPVTWEILSAAAMRHSEDSETMSYLLRAAARFRSGGRGYAVVGNGGEVQHFAWVARYEGFVMEELNEVLRAPTEGSVLIVDCWTPRQLRGRGLYAQAIRQLAALLSAEGKSVWIFTAAANTASVAGIKKAGFQMHAARVRRKVLGWAKIREESHEAPRSEQAEALSDEAVR
jgi:CelD/BcsL family acetyltransferase involved in cellulose biosynthesis